MSNKIRPKKNGEKLNNYFDKGISRTSSTARIPKEVHEELCILKDKIRNNTDLKVSLNDLVTIGAIIVAKTDPNELEGLDKIKSYNDLIRLLELNMRAQ
ncbi:hypothetical protein [Pseudoalteromonas nigrifaciens]|uniref:hypothetical protein n=1 Tax=Pseudoalteromonas nigrifaciens TaxID=28109 RepID=UPI003FD19897